MKRSHTENLIIIAVTVVWGITNIVGLVTSRMPEPALHYIMGLVVGAVLGVKAWRNGRDHGEQQSDKERSP
jgi:hypothetical protein